MDYHRSPPGGQGGLARDMRRGAAIEVYVQRHDLEEIRGLLGHTQIETTQLHFQIRPAALLRTESTRSAEQGLPFRRLSLGNASMVFHAR
jgi:hypothetical protein